MVKQLALLLWFTIVLFPYLGLPQNEDTNAFLNGQKLKYHTNGHPKAKGLKISIEYPSHWNCQEGERSNIVQKFIGTTFDGFNPTCLILIKDLPEDTKLFSEQELADTMFSSEGLKAMIPPGALFLKGEQTKYDGQPGAWILYSMLGTRAGFKVDVHVLQHALLYSGKLILLQCSIGGLPGNQRTTEELFSQYLTLFQLMGNSIVIHDKWEKIAADKDTNLDSNINDAVGESWVLVSVLSFFLFLGIGLTPPALIRFIVIKRPIAKGWAYAIVILFGLVNLVIFTILGGTSKTVLLVSAWTSYAILRTGAKKQHATKEQVKTKAPVPKQAYSQNEDTDIETYEEIDDSLMNEKDKTRVYGAVLGLHGTVTKQEIIDAYKKLIAKYHPDKVSHLGEEFQKYAEKKTREINKAFYYLKRKYTL